MPERPDPRLQVSTDDLAARYGADAVVIARKLACEHEDLAVAAFWGGVLALLAGRD